MTQKFAGVSSSKNATRTPLGVAETWTGKWEDCTAWDSVAFAVKASHSCTLYAEFTSDPTFAVTDSTLTYNIGTFNEVHVLTITRKFFRLRILNNGTEQTYLSVDTEIGSHPPLTAPMNLALGEDADANAVRPSIFTDEVIIGRRKGVSHFNKFSYRTTLTAASGEETVWETTGNFTPMTVASTFTITYNSGTDGLGTTGATQLYFYYIDSDGLSTISPHVLSNTGSDVTSFSGLGINRVVVSSSGSAQFNNNIITVTETTGATKQAVLPAEESTTQQAIFHCDSNSDAIAKYLSIHVNKLSGGGTPRVLIKGYVFNRQFETRYQIFRTTIDTSSTTEVIISEPIGFKLSPTDVIYFVADTDTNNTSINIRFSLLEYKRN